MFECMKALKTKSKKKFEQNTGPSRATYDVENDLGGLTNITNQSEISNRSVATEINTKRAIESRNTDPLRQLVNKLKQDGESNSLSMNHIIIENGTYNVSLIKELSVKNISNFCCTENKNYKSSLSFNFTFELLKDPPLLAFVTTYKNTSLKVKGRNHSHTRLGPILLCHDRKTETVEKFLEKLTEKVRGIRQYIQVIGCDSKISIINASCSSFPAAILLLCANHAKQNITEKLRDLVCDADLKRLYLRLSLETNLQ